MPETNHTFKFLLTDSVLHTAERRPEHLAFSCGNATMTYAQLVEKMNQLAGLLLSQGLQKGDRVGIYLNRSLETAIAIYGILRAGGVYVPLDPNAPIKRTLFQLEDCEIRHLITQPGQKRSLAKIMEERNPLRFIIGLAWESGPESISWQQLFDLPAATPQAPKMMAQDLAYIMYTSGSTGLPKGMMHTHYSGLSYAKLMVNTYGLHQDDRFGNHSPIHFDISTLGYFAAPLVGATTVIFSDAYIKMTASLSQLIEKEAITVWYSVPLALIQLLHRGVLEERDMPHLRWVLFAGEVFPTKYLRELMQYWPQARFSNIYGPAETNQCTNYNLDTPPTTDDPIPLGKTWEDTQMLILNEQEQEVEKGETGELLIRSATMMQGYWKRPDLTEKGFYHQETIAGFRETYYRTGDLVREDANGLLHFLGRKDQQIKTRGYRVELEAVEYQLGTLKVVKEAAVFPYRNGAEEVVIIGAVILQQGQDAEEKELISGLKEQLPWYALPQSIFKLEDFPRTGTEKIDRPGLSEILSEKIKQIHG